MVGLFAAAPVVVLASGAMPIIMGNLNVIPATGTCTLMSGDCKIFLFYQEDRFFSNDCPNAPNSQPDVTIVGVKDDGAYFGGQQLGTWGPPPS